MEAKIIAANGRPLRSTYENILGACDCSAKEARVLEDPNMAEFPTLNTAIMITAFITLGSIVEPALSTAMTNGLAVAPTELSPPRRRRSLKGTRRLTKRSD